MTQTSSFGTPRCEAHDASAFYARGLFQAAEWSATGSRHDDPEAALALSIPMRPQAEWANRIYNSSAEAMHHVPDASVGLAFTSPPYNVGKDYEDDVGWRTIWR